MSGGKSAYMQANALDEELGGQDWTPPASVWIALSTQAWDPSATGSAMDEVVGGSYARQELTNDLTSFPAASGASPASKSTGVDVAFPTATADWGTVLSAYIVDAETDGNILRGSDATTPIPMPNGSTLVIPAGTWNFSEQ